MSDKAVIPFPVSLPDKAPFYVAISMDFFFSRGEPRQSGQA